MSAESVVAPKSLKKSEAGAETVIVAASTLIPYPRNPRKNDAAVDRMVASIREFGFKVPILARSNGDVVDGHLRLKAAQVLGIAQVPVILCDEWSPEQVKAFRLLVNRSANWAEWDDAAVALEVAELEAAGFDLSLTGFDPAELDAFARAGNEDAEDEVPEPPKTPVTKPGDLWLLGPHRLLCGDSTVEANVARLLGDVKIDACVTDPPYGIGLTYGGFEDTSANVTVLIRKAMPLIQSFPCAALTSGQHASLWAYPKPAWIGAWIHPAANGGCPWGFDGTNLILYYGKDPYLKRRLGRRPDHIVLAADRQGVEGHPTPKPLKVWQWLVERVSPVSGERIFDPFLGSGTTVIAAQSLHRISLGLELSPAYCDVIVERWQQFTGQKAKREKEKAPSAQRQAAPVRGRADRGQKQTARGA
jgi:hypothetical protein